MKLNKHEANNVRTLIEDWKEKNLVSSEQAEQLSNSLEVKESKWKTLASYAFSIALVSMILAVIVLLADKPVRLFLESMLNLTLGGISILTGFIGILFFLFSHKRIVKKRSYNLSNISLVIFSSFLMLISLAFGGKALSVGEQHMYMLFYFGFALYFILTLIYKFNFLWVIAFLMLVLGAGFHLHIFNDFQGYYLGMNWVMRFVPIAFFLLLLSFIISKVTFTKHFYNTHFYTSWIFLLLVFWVLSIAGNYTDFNRWMSVSQLTLFIYALVSLMLCLVVLFYGWQKQDKLLGNIALIFLLLNLFTRYFEYLWKPLHKALFFFILGFIFILIGRVSEKYWNKQI
jgi:hypothetical protein